jgi:hypothetical protein
MVLDTNSAPSVSCSVSIGQPLSVQVPGVVLVNVTLAVIVPAAPSPSLKTPVKSLPLHVEPITAAVVVVVVDVDVVVDEVVVVVVDGSMAWRLITKITTKAAKIASDFSARLTD